MAYLVKADYSRLIAVTLLDEILAQASETSGLTADQCLTNAYNMATAEVKAYLNKLFDMPAEFSKDSSAENRNENVIRAVIHIVLYNLHFTINPHDIPEMRQKAYEAMTGPKGELAAVRDGVLDWELTARTSDEQTGYRRTEIASSRKFISKPFVDPVVTENYSSEEPS